MPDLNPSKEAQEPTANSSEPPPPAPAALPAKPKSRVQLFVLIGCIALVLTAAVVVGYRRLHRGLPEGLIQANGRIEGDRISVASKFAGRISRMFVREGDSVTNGRVLAVLEAKQFEAKVSQALAASRALAAQLQAAQTSLEVMKLDVPMGIEIAQAGVAHAQAALAKANAGENQARRDSKRFRELLAPGSADNHRSETSDLAALVATSVREAARAGLKHAEKQLAQARLGVVRIQAQSDSVAVLASQLDQGRAVHVEAESVLKDLAPKALQTSDERVKLVFAVKLYLTENPSHRLSPGLPADAVILWQEGIAWQNPRW